MVTARRVERAQQRIVEVLSEKVVDRLSYVQYADVEAVDSQFIDLTITVAIDRTFVEDSCGKDIAAELMGPDPCV